MPGLLTTAATIQCPHGGTVQGSPSNPRVSADGATLLSAADLFTVAGCPFNLSGVPHPCVSVRWVQPSGRSTTGGNPTLTMASVGLCIAGDQAAQGTVLIGATQQKAVGL